MFGNAKMVNSYKRVAVKRKNMAKTAKIFKGGKSMRKKAARSFLSLILAAAMVVIGLPSAVYAADTSAKESEEVIETAEGEDIIDIAPYAAVSTDYVSSWENLNG